MQFIKIFLSSLCVLLVSQNSYAAELSIEDSSGIVRNISDISSSATIKFKVTDSDGNPLNGALINLTSKDSNEKRQGLSVDGVVEFLNVSAGQWVVSTEDPKLLLAQIDISDYTTFAMASLDENSALLGSGGGSASLLAGAAILATGITVGTTNSSNTKTEMSPHS